MKKVFKFNISWKSHKSDYNKKYCLKEAVFCLLLLLSLAPTSRAQQQPQYTQYLLNYFLLNPALAGSESFWDVKTGYRNQWTGLEGAPKTVWLSVHKPINYPVSFVKREKQRMHHGLGGFLFHDNTGTFSLTSTYISYAYHIMITPSLTASLGVSAGFEQFSMNERKFVFIQDPEDELQGKFHSNRINPNSTAGLWIYSDKFFAGLSGQNLLHSRKILASEGGGTGLPKFRSFTFAGGYRWKMNRHYSFIPSVLVKASLPAPIQIDVNLKARYKEVAWAGLSFRKEDAIAFLSGFNIRDRLTLGYSYDFIVSKLNNGTSGSHEIVIGMRLHPKGKIVCPEKYW
jgi:type IX secretion system PorP/SprF family membrane protein